MSSEESTKARQGRPAAPLKAPAWVRFGMRALATGAPPLAAWAGERLFLTPPRHEAPAREGQALREAAAFEVPFRGGRLRAWRWGGEGAPVLLVHGWGGRGGQMASFAPSLVAAGLPVVTFDGPAHGRSDGRLASAPDFAAAIRAAVERLHGVRAVVSHSMGAPATVLALRDGLAVEAAVFVGGSLGPRGFLRQFGQALGLSETTRASWSCTTAWMPKCPLSRARPSPSRGRGRRWSAPKGSATDASSAIPRSWPESAISWPRISGPALRKRRVRRGRQPTTRRAAPLPAAPGRSVRRGTRTGASAPPARSPPTSSTVRPARP